MGSVVVSHTDRWTAIATNDDGVTVKHAEGIRGRPVHLTQIAAAPASPWTSDYIAAHLSKVDDGLFEAIDAEKRSTGSINGGFAQKDYRVPLHWHFKVAKGGTSQQMLLDLWRPDHQAIDLVSGQTLTGLQLKGRPPASAASRANFTNTASLGVSEYHHGHRLKWAISDAEWTAWSKEGIFQLELALSVGDTFQAWQTRNDTQPDLHAGQIVLDFEESVVLTTPAHGSWYHRAKATGTKVSIEDAAAP